MLALAYGDVKSAPSPWPKAEKRLALGKSRLLDLSDVGDVSDLALDGEQLIVSGTCGVARIALGEGRILASAKYGLPCPPALDGRIVDVDGDGKLEIARFDEGWVGPVAVLELTCPRSETAGSSGAAVLARA